MFAHDVFGIDPWAGQQRVLRAVPRRKRVAVRSCHKVGKTNSAAVLGLWWYATQGAGSRVILTAPSYRQVDEVLYREVRLLFQRAKKRGIDIGGTLHETPNRGLRHEDGRQLLGFTASDAESFSGVSAPRILYIVDEASGVDELIYEAIEGNAASGAHVLLISNPTKTSGTFYRAFTDRRSTWHTEHLSAFDSPNVKAGREVVRGLVMPDWVKARAQEWGVDSPWYQVRVLGDFPSTSDTNVISLHEVEQARGRWRGFVYGTEETPARLELGVDVARFGSDETVIQPRRGRRTGTATVMRSMDVVDVAGHVNRIAGELRLYQRERVVVKVDTVGLGGGVADVLRRIPDLDIVDVNVARASDDEERYHLLRDQLWFGVRDWLREGGELPEDEKLLSELTAPQYSFDARGRYLVESKDKMKARVGRSPDRADALALAVYGSQLPTEVGGTNERGSDAARLAEVW